MGYERLGGPQLGGNTTARTHGEGSGGEAIGSELPISRLRPVTGAALGPATLPATAAHTAQDSSASTPTWRCEAAMETRTAKQSAVSAATQRREVQCLDVIASMRNRTMCWILVDSYSVAISHRRS
jgi:hypothetical protein